MSVSWREVEEFVWNPHVLKFVGLYKHIQCNECIRMNFKLGLYTCEQTTVTQHAFHIIPYVKYTIAENTNKVLCRARFRFTVQRISLFPADYTDCMVYN